MGGERREREVPQTPGHIHPLQALKLPASHHEFIKLCFFFATFVMFAKECGRERGGGDLGGREGGREGGGREYTRSLSLSHTKYLVSLSKTRLIASFSLGCTELRPLQISNKVVEPSAAPVATRRPFSSTRSACKGMAVT